MVIFKSLVFTCVNSELEYPHIFPDSTDYTAVGVVHFGVAKLLQETLILIPNIFNVFFPVIHIMENLCD